MRKLSLKLFNEWYNQMTYNQWFGVTSLYRFLGGKNPYKNDGTYHKYFNEWHINVYVPFHKENVNYDSLDGLRSISIMENGRPGGFIKDRNYKGFKKLEKECKP